MLIEKIKKHTQLSKHVEPTCCENNICVTLDENIETKSYVILKVDKFYNDLKIANRPPSIDCLIIRECEKIGYGLTLVELKNIKSAGSFTFDNLKNKFNTTLNDFIKVKFKDLLDRDYTEIKLYFVSQIENNKRDKGLKIESLMDFNFKFNSKTIRISPVMPNPTIKKCYTKV